MKITFSPFDKKEIAIKVELTLGRASATVYTCDFSYEYVVSMENITDGSNC